MARILLVDDDPQILDLLHFSLSMQGHETIRAANGLEAIAAVRRDRPDVIVMDQRMPGMDGRTASLVLRSNPDTEAIPVVMVTSCTTDDDVWRGYRAGVASYIAKPINLDVLEWEIERVLEPTPATA
jgi:CheY-like chemotaxis protein